MALAIAIVSGGCLDRPYGAIADDSGLSPDVVVPPDVAQPPDAAGLSDAAVPPDGSGVPDAAAATCGEQGGICRNLAFDVCPVEFQPDFYIAADCTWSSGCCLPAPEYTCNQGEWSMCVEPGYPFMCTSMAEDQCLTCAEDRVCLELDPVCE